MNFFAELKRRKVFKVGAAYLVVAWLAVQVVSIAFPAFDAPPWALRVVILLAVLGFPVTLMLAWAFESTPEGVKRDASTQGNKRMAAIAGAFVVLALGWYFFAPVMQPREQVAAEDASNVAAPTTPAPTSAPPVDPKSIAVLPFANLSDDRANEYFVSGMQDMILTKLAEVGELRVASRTSTEKYAEHKASVREIAAELRVAYILEGSVQKAGNQVLINVQLIDGRSDEHLWAQSYQRTLDDIFGVEGEVAKLVAEALHAELSVAEAAALSAVGTHHKDAYDRYLRSRYFLNQSNRSLDLADLDRSIELAKEAVALDPSFIDAWALLSLAHIKRNAPGGAKDAEAAARQVLALDPNNAEGHLHLGFALAASGRRDEAIAEAREAARLRPDKMNIQSGLGISLASAGRFEEAKVPLAAAANLAPDSNFVRNWQAVLFLTLREYAAARDLASATLVRDPGNQLTVALLVDAQLLGFGDIESARQTLRKVPTAPANSSALALQWAEVEMWGRDFAAARRHLEQISPDATLWDNLPRSYYLAPVLEAQGETAAAKAAYTDARDRLQASLTTNQDDVILQRSLALMLSGLGEHAAALRTAEHTLARAAENAFNTQWCQRILAEVQLRAGRPAEAVQTLRSLLQAPAGTAMSAQDLRLNPAWDPLRGKPEFAALLQEFPATPDE